MKIITAILLLLIFCSLGSAMYYMIKDKGKGTRMVRSLSIRIGLSLLLFIVMMVVARIEMLSS
ncbi:MAG: twin transmembrane helix small protein [Nitrosomonas sp.]|nr:twin transmembrane helix small protein [Nitrosomonas sp.]MDP1951614.1 twin transmembrane helix small protein [Nitrosomonas sp.]